MKFSIRDLLLVTVIVALAVAWWVDRSNLAREVTRLGNSLDATDKKLTRALSVSIRNSKAGPEPELPNHRISMPNPPKP